MIDRPAAVRVGPLIYRVLWDGVAVERYSASHADEGSEWAAFADHEQLVIGVNPVHAVSSQRHSLVHEVLHACLRLSAFWPDQYAHTWVKSREEGPGVEELTVGALSGPLLGVLVDNPGLTAWLTADASGGVNGGLTR